MKSAQRALGSALVLAMLLGVAVPLPAEPARAGDELLPDLGMAPFRDFHIEMVNGRRLLRFTAMMVNVGAGHFELRGSRASTSDPMVMSQVIYDTTARGAAPVRQIPTSAVAMFSGDGHNHWHVQEMMRYDMWGPSGTFRGAKVGFCFLDSDPWNTALPGAGRYYTASTCGTNPGILSNRMGISVGWGDEYEWYLAWQWVDITGVPAGTYTVRAKVDPYGFFLESDEANQCTFARVSFGLDSNAVTVNQQGSACVNDIDDSIFAADIGWAFDAGVTVGCAPDLFCTSSVVMRDQMASFLTRSLGLQATGTDYFTDDAGSAHESDINRVAAAGITTGCAPTLYCPTFAVTREQMASFLVRALGLPATETDFFTDDAGTPHESDINRLAASGITTGCAAARFCPGLAVTRGEMVAFLHRAVDQAS